MKGSDRVDWPDKVPITLPSLPYMWIVWILDHIERTLSGFGLDDAWLPFDIPHLNGKEHVWM